MQNRRLSVVAFCAVIATHWLAWITAADAAPQFPVVVPYRIAYDGALTVEVTVNGRGPYDFIIDTGATLTAAFENLARSESFTLTGGEPRRVLGITSSTLLRPYLLGDIGVGDAALNDHVGIVLPDWRPDRTTPHGILGSDFFRSYAAVFDVGARTMTLYPRGAIPGERIKKWRRIKLRAEGYALTAATLYTAKALVNRKFVTFIIDLGSPTTLVNFPAAEALFSAIVTRDLGEGFISGSRLRDVFDDRTKTRVARFKQIKLSGATWSYVTVWVKDAPVFEELGVAEKPYGLLGADLLATQDFALDFGENLLYVSKVNQPRR